MATLAWSDLGLRDHELQGDRMKSGLFVSPNGTQKPFAADPFCSVVLRFRDYMDLLSNDLEKVYRVYHSKDCRGEAIGHLDHTHCFGTHNARLRIDWHISACTM